MPKKNNISPDYVVAASIVAAPVGALLGCVNGSIGNFALSFFNPVMANSIKHVVVTSAALGAIALPLMILPKYLTDHFINNSKFLRKNPNLHGFVKETTDILITLGSVATAAVLLGTPFAASVVSMMIIPAAMYALSTLCLAINAVVNAKESSESQVPTSLMFL